MIRWRRIATGRYGGADDVGGEDAKLNIAVARNHVRMLGNTLSSDVRRR